MYEIETGVKQKALKVVIYGVEGIGKSTLASKFPNPLFIDTENSTDHMDVRRLKRPTSYQELLSMIKWVRENKPCSTLIIDTADWALTLIEESVRQDHNIKSIESLGYGQGYVEAREKFGKLIDELTEVADAGINVVVTAHAEIRKFEDPGEQGAYDRYELKLTKRSNAHIAGMTKEWADMVLFLNYEIMAVKREGMGNKYKAEGGKRVMYTTHHPAWDAKNRFGLPNKLDIDYSQIAHVIPDLVNNQPTNQATPQAQPVQTTPEPVQESKEDLVIDPSELQIQMDEEHTELPDYLPSSLTDLMKADGITVDELKGVMGVRGHYPINTDFKTIADTQPEYFTGGLVANWDGVKQVVEQVRNDKQLIVDLLQKVGDPDAQTTVNSMNVKWTN